jgi:hypothetical protein
MRKTSHRERLAERGVALDTGRLQATGAQSNKTLVQIRGVETGGAEPRRVLPAVSPIASFRDRVSVML